MSENQYEELKKELLNGYPKDTKKISKTVFNKKLKSYAEQHTFIKENLEKELIERGFIKNNKKIKFLK